MLYTASKYKNIPKVYFFRIPETDCMSMTDTKTTVLFLKMTVPPHVPALTA